MNKIAQIFQSLDYGPAPEGPDQANAWLDSHGRKFGHFIDGKWTKPGKTFASDNPANGEKLADITDGSAEDAPWPYGLEAGAKGVQLAELGLKSWAERRWLDVPKLEF
jgi:aldehyde dehydrogenase (NAD+)